MRFCAIKGENIVYYENEAITDFRTLEEYKTKVFETHPRQEAERILYDLINWCFQMYGEGYEVKIST